MVARPDKPIYPACVPPQSHPPTSRELFVPVSGASPKTSSDASATVSESSLVHRTEPLTSAISVRSKHEQLPSLWDSARVLPPSAALIELSNQE
jgi:hypothetical protein